VTSLPETIACPDCDLLQRIPPLLPGGRARCARCSKLLATQRSDPFDRALALTIAAAITFIVANTHPLMDLSAVGRTASTTIIGGAYEMWLQGRDHRGDRRLLCRGSRPGGIAAFSS
jgi:paraquat-inducible protein A